MIKGTAAQSKIIARGLLGFAAHGQIPAAHRARCDPDHKESAFRQMHAIDLNATSIMLDDHSGTDARRRVDVVKLAVTTGLLIGMTLAASAVSARVVDRGAGLDRVVPNRILLASASASSFSLTEPARAAYPAEWFEPPIEAAAPAIKTSAVWHASPRREETGPPSTALIGLLVASALAFSAFLAFGRMPARGR